MFKTNTVKLIVFLLVTLITVLLIQLFFSERKTSDKTSDPVIRFENSPSPIPTPKELFYIQSNSLVGGSLAATDSFLVTFSEPINIATLKYSISPDIGVVITNSPSPENTLTVAPKTTWDFDTEYILTFDPATKSINQKNLDRNSIIKFKTRPYFGI